MRTLAAAPTLNLHLHLRLQMLAPCSNHEQEQEQDRGEQMVQQQELWTSRDPPPVLPASTSSYE